MKNLLLLSFLLIFNYSFSFAQNSVTVTQQGNGNKATITQSGTDSSKAAMDISCEEEKKKLGFKNSITVHSNRKTIIDTTGIPANRYLGIIGDENELFAFQYGRSNSLSLLLPDTAGAHNLLATYQNGSGNMLSTIFNSSHQNLNLSQSGTGNSIAINPCGAQAK